MDTLFQQGQRYEYALELASAANVSGQAALLDFTLRARLVANVHVDAPLAQIALTNISLETRAEGPDAGVVDAASLARQLTVPFFLEYSEGMVQRLFVTRDVSKFGLGIVRTLAAALQAPVEFPVGHVRTLAEHDATGDYMAEYAVSRSATGDWTYLKRKLHYEPLTIPGARSQHSSLALRPEVLEFDGRIGLKGGQAESLSFSEVVSSTLFGTTKLTGKTRLSLALTTTGGVEQVAWDERKGQLELGVFEDYAPQSREVDLDAERIGDFTIESVLQALRDEAQDPLYQRAVANYNDEPVDPEGQGQGQRAVAEHQRLFLALSSILRKQPTSIERVKSELLRGSPIAGILLDALAASRSERAEAVLLDLMRGETLTMRQRRAAARSLIGIERASDRTVSAFIQLLNPGPLQAYAQYGLGTIARKLRDVGEHERAERASNALIARLRDATDASERRHLLRGIANSGAREALGDVLPLLHDADPTLRGAAVEALRLMEDANVNPLIAERLDVETESSALRAALNAAQTRTADETLVTAVERVARESEDALSRSSAIALLEQWQEEFPTIRNTLEFVASIDPRPGLRLAAEQALAK